MMHTTRLTPYNSRGGQSRSCQTSQGIKTEIPDVYKGLGRSSQTGSLCFPGCLLTFPLHPPDRGHKPLAGQQLFDDCWSIAPKCNIALVIRAGPSRFSWVCL